MKKSVLLSAILFGGLFYNSAQAQISVHIGLNIPVRRVYVPAPPPQPVMVYDTDEFDDSDDYYYLPEVEAYYSVPRHCYYYQDGGRWISAAYLPGAYRNYDWRTARRYEIRARRPYMRHEQYRSKWGGNYDRGNWSWNRRDNRDNNNYAGRRYDNNRNDWNRDNNRNDWNRHNERNDWNRNNNRNDRPQGGFSQPNRNPGGQGGYNQPSQPDRNNGGGRGSWGRDQQQPTRNGNHDRDRDSRGGNDNFKFASSKGGFGQGHRQTRF
ncbi:hypothetical protein [Mucilaginibacter sp. AK015]|uniref:hypothetical protein n=1 Tax=Mucilaginibacter sp. AK015 TaxID=2723072 RepID=UPI001609458C|nr:hypothetical protein [Mucilaginibacter sp. AK015]MBB5394380.1 hypothetical protein [Mucilaginibacter sp. AK015]